MNMKASFLAAALLSTGSAFATPINMSGSEANLQQILNSVTCQSNQPGCVLGGASSVNVLTDQVVGDELWSLGGSGGAFSQIVIELAGYAPYARFGIYDANNSNNRVEMFAGSASAGSQALVSMDGSGRVYRNFVDTGAVFANNVFGFYLEGPGGIWFSDNALNSDSADHMVAYQGTGEDRIKLSGSSAGTWGQNEYILAWEDLAKAGWDYDYNDFVVMVESITTVPEPGTLALLGLSLAGMGFSLSRRKARAQA